MTVINGTLPNQSPTNQDLGSLAFNNADDVGEISTDSLTVTRIKRDSSKVSTLIGSDANQVPTNNDLGQLAYQNADNVVIKGGNIQQKNTVATYLENVIKTEENTVTPSLQLNFSKTEKLDPRMVFTRASTATFVGGDGLVKTAAANVPRFDHDPITGECKGVMIEESRTNLLNYSEQFDNAYWTKTNSTITANTSSTVAPDGSTTADILLETTTNGIHAVSRSYSFTVGTSYTFSVFAKPAGRSILVIGAGNTTTLPILAFFDLSTETVTTVLGTARIEKFPNGWYRCSCSSASAATTTANTNINYYTALTGTTTLYAGDTTKGLFLWGAQVESGAFSTSYIQTVASAATRSADLLTMPATTWYNQDGGTIYLDAYAEYDRISTTYCGINDGTSSNQVGIRSTGTGSTLQAFVDVGGTTVGDPGAVGPALGQVTLNSRFKAAFSFDASSCYASKDGSVSSIDSATSLYQPLTSLCIGTRNSATTESINGCVKEFRFYTKKLSQQELVELTV